MILSALSLLIGLASPDTTAAQMPADPMFLPVAQATVDTRTHEITVDLPGIPVPAHTGHHEGMGGGLPPVVRFEMPLDASLYGFRVEVVDGSGQPLPLELIHHFNLIDPHHRELFLPISRRVMASGKETGAQEIPWFLFGVPLQKGALLVATGMLHNPTETDYPDVRMRLVLQYVQASRPWPFWKGFPFQLDVAFPVGDKSFELPPGKSSRSYEGSPSVAGKIAVVGGHVHELATRIELVDVNQDKVIWSTVPTMDKEKNVVAVPSGKLYRLGSLGYAVTPEGKYRVTVYYDNTTGEPVMAGGMGVIGGFFIPEKEGEWPAADRTDPLYRADAIHFLRVKPDSSAMEHEHNHMP